MSNASSSNGNFGQTVQHAARTATETVSTALDRGAAAASQVSDLVTRFRSTMRRQPITMAFVMLAIGYMIGTQLRR